MVGTRSPCRRLLRETPPRGDLFSSPAPRSRTSKSSRGQRRETSRRCATHYAGFHPHLRAVITACPEVHKWVLVERDPLPRWREGRVVLLGDAIHPMTPYMAQGAATAMDAAAVLSRCLDRIDADGVVDAFSALRTDSPDAHFANPAHFASEHVRGPTPIGYTDTTLGRSRWRACPPVAS
jgi:2-polyprenyl-6-methoxyphenol hydroxylase-like FAD-dependent oxidoreductase